MNILITNISRRVYLIDFINDIKRIYKNIKIHLADNDDYTAAFSYKKISIHKIPLVSESRNKYINSIKKIVIKNKIQLIIPSSKHDLEILSLYKEKFKKFDCCISVSSNELVKNLLDKEATYFLCKKHNIKTPHIYSNINQIKDKDLKKKYIQKKKFGHTSIGNLVIKKINTNHFKKNYIIQDFIEGRELHFDILNDFEGNYLASCVKKKISMRSGETDKAIAIYSKKLENLSKKISTSFKHVGNLDCDAIETKNGSIFFLDFNPVFGGGYPFTHLSGFNFIKAIINLRKNKKVHLPKKPKIKKISKGISAHIIK